MIDRWLEEGDRLSEAGQAFAGSAASHEHRRLRGLMANVGAGANRHRVAVISGVGLLTLLAVIGAYRPSSVASESQRSTTLAVVPAKTAASTPSGEPQPETNVGARQILATAPGPAATMPKPEPLRASPRVLTMAPVAVLAVAPTAAKAPTAEKAPARAHAIADEPIPSTTADEPVPPAHASDTRESAGHADSSTRVEACKTALKRERAREALSACRLAADRAPDSADALVLLAHADLLAGREGETLRLAQRASELDPRCADAYLLIGNVQQSAGNKPRARRAYESYLQLAPHGVHAAEIRAVLSGL